MERRRRIRSSRSLLVTWSRKALDYIIPFLRQKQDTGAKEESCRDRGGASPPSAAAIENIKHAGERVRWLKHLLLFQRIQVQFPAPTLGSWLVPPMAPALGETFPHTSTHVHTQLTIIKVSPLEVE